MNNIHAPTIPSGPTNGVQLTGPISIAELQSSKNDMEAELRTLSHILDSHGVTMDTPLVTRDGFPRSDIDVAQVRTTRHQIVCLRNDYKALMNQIEKQVHEIFASQMSTENSVQNEPTQPISETSIDDRPLHDYTVEDLLPIFAKVNTVVDGSPAAEAGLKPGDMIRSFGYVNVRNHDGLKKVAECVQGNENCNITVKVARATPVGTLQEHSLNLNPRRYWGGRGMLGCHILPVS